MTTAKTGDRIQAHKLRSNVSLPIDLPYAITLAVVVALKLHVATELPNSAAKP